MENNNSGRIARFSQGNSLWEMGRKNPSKNKKDRHRRNMGEGKKNETERGEFPAPLETTQKKDSSSIQRRPRRKKKERWEEELNLAKGSPSSRKTGWEEKLDLRVLLLIAVPKRGR